MASLEQVEILLVNRVHWVKDGEEALEYLFRHPERAPAQTPKLVMLDLRMPKVGGIEVLRQLKANSYIVKPVGFEAFLETVSKIGLYWVLTNRTPQ